MSNDHCLVEDIGVIPSADASRSSFWLIVRRTFKRADTPICWWSCSRFSRRATRMRPQRSVAWLVDCGAIYQGAAATQISGLSHLTGQDVAIIADGVAASAV